MLKKVDKYGHPITLTFEDEDTFRTSFGGCMTLLSIMSLMIYFFIMLSTAIYQTKYTITNSKQIMNLYNDTNPY